MFPLLKDKTHGPALWLYILRIVSRRDLTAFMCASRCTWYLAAPLLYSTVLLDAYTAPIQWYYPRRTIARTRAILDTMGSKSRCYAQFIKHLTITFDIDYDGDYRIDYLISTVAQANNLETLDMTVPYPVEYITDGVHEYFDSFRKLRALKINHPPLATIFLGAGCPQLQAAYLGNVYQRWKPYQEWLGVLKLLKKYSGTLRYLQVVFTTKCIMDAICAIREVIQPFPHLKVLCIHLSVDETKDRRLSIALSDFIIRQGICEPMPEIKFVSIGIKSTYGRDPMHGYHATISYLRQMCPNAVLVEVFFETWESGKELRRSMDWDDLYRFKWLYERKGIDPEFAEPVVGREGHHFSLVRFLHTVIAPDDQVATGVNVQDALAMLQE